MSRTVTRANLRTRSSQLANVENDGSFTTTELDSLINLHVPAVHDLLVAAGQYIAASTTVSVVANTIVYALPADFLSLENVWVHESDDYRRPLDPIQDRQRQHFRAPTQACTVTLEYCPAAPVFDDDVDTFDGVDGFDELVSARVARDILVKREGDVSAVMAIIAATEKRVRSVSTQRHRGGPKMIVDVESDHGWPRAVQLDGFRLRGGNIELYSSLWGPFV